MLDEKKLKLTKAESIISVLLFCLVVVFLILIKSEVQPKTKLTLLNNKNTENLTNQNQVATSSIQKIPDSEKRKDNIKELCYNNDYNNFSLYGTSGLIALNFSKAMINGWTYFVRESDNYVLHAIVGGKDTKPGLIIPVQFDPCGDLASFIHGNFEAQLSPDGNKIAYLAKPKNTEKELGQQYLYISDLAGKNIEEIAKPSWTYGHGAIGNIYWDTNSKNIFYTDNQGDEGGSNIFIYKYDLENKKKTLINSSKCINAELQDTDTIAQGYLDCENTTSFEIVGLGIK